MNIEIHEISDGHAHGAIWLDNGTALPISMPAEAYETAIQSGFLTLVADMDALDQINMDGVLAFRDTNQTNLNDSLIDDLRKACDQAFRGALSAWSVATNRLKKSDE